MRKTCSSKRISLLSILLLGVSLFGCDGSGTPEPPAVNQKPQENVPAPVNRPDLELPDEVPTDADRIAFYLSLLEAGDVDQVGWATAQLGQVPEAAAPALGKMLARNVVRNPLLAQNILQVFATTVPGTGQVGPMAAAAKSTDGLVRFTTAPALGNTGDEAAIPVLLDLLGDSDGRVASGALLAIERLGTPAGTQGVVGRFPDQMALSAVSLAMQFLGRALPPERLEPILLTAWESDEPALLISSGVALLELDRAWLPRVRKKVAPLLKSPFRPLVLNLLARAGDPEILPGLIADAASENRDTAMFAIQRLMHYRTEEAIRALWSAARSANHDIRREAWFALIEAGQENVFKRLDALLTSRIPEDRILAAEVLAGRPERPSGPQLTAALEKEESFEVARKLANAIALLHYREGAVAIAGLLGRETKSSPFHSVDALTASTSLLNLATLPEEAVKILLTLVSSENEAIRVHTTRVLGRACSGPAVRDALAKLLTDPSVHVRSQALVSWLALQEATVAVLVGTYSTETDPDTLKSMRKSILQLYYRWPH